MQGDGKPLVGPSFLGPKSYRRHTNFSQESIEQVFSGQADAGRKVSCVVSRNGDLIHKVFVRTKLPAVAEVTGKKFAWVEEVGHFLIKSCDLEIGGQRIDKTYGEWLSIWTELTMAPGLAPGYRKMIGDTAELTAATTSKDSEVLYVPLQFFFCRNPGLALPLIALQLTT